MSLEKKVTQERASRQVVLIPGSYSEGRVWDFVADGLRERGFGLTVVDLPSNSGLASAGLYADGRYVEALLDELNEPTVAVGHSYGGIVLSELAGHPNVSHAVYIAAFVPTTGASMQDLVGGHFPAWVLPDPPGSFYSVDPAEAVRVMAGNAGSAERDKLFVEKLVPQSQAAGTEASTTRSAISLRRVLHASRFFGEQLGNSANN